MLDLEEERAVLAEAIASLDHSQYVTARQVQALASLVGQGLTDKRRDNRIAVMDYLIGQPIKDALGVEFTSFKNISGAIASMLIDLFLVPGSQPWGLNQYGKEIISSAESYVKASAVQHTPEDIQQSLFA